MSQAEHIVEAAADAFRREFESTLRKRLMAELEQEVEHMVREVAGKVHAQLTLWYDERNMSLGLDFNVRIK